MLSELKMRFSRQILIQWPVDGVNGVSNKLPGDAQAADTQFNWSSKALSTLNIVCKINQFIYKCSRVQDPRNEVSVWFIPIQEEKGAG